MSYTDKHYFTFPIKVYDGFSLRRAMDREESTDVAEDGEWIIGKCKLPADEIDGWFDLFSRGRSVEDVEREGFDSTLILTKTKGEFICTWTSKEFEQRYDAFMENYEKLKVEEIDRTIAKFKLAED